LRIQEVYGTDTVVCFAGYPVLRRAPRLISHNVTALTDEYDDLIYNEEDEPTEYDLQYVVTELVRAHSRCFLCE
jgi:hypothetical protein